MGTWKTYKLGEVAKVIMGQSPESQYYNTAGSGLPFHQGVASFGERFVKTEQYTSVYSKVAQPGDILFSVRAPVGRLNLTEETIAIGRGLAALRAKEDVDKIFLFYALKRKFFKDNLIGSGAIFAAVSRNELESQELPLPPLEEQERIAGVLGAYDDLIAVNERRMVLLEEAAHRLYRDRFVTHANSDWTLRPLGEVAPLRRGKIITEATAQPGCVPVVAGGLEPAYWHNQANTTAPVLTVAGSGANAGFARLYYEDVWASDCSYVDRSEQAPVYFAYCFLKDNKRKIENFKRGAAQPHVYPADLNALEGHFDRESIQTFEAQVSPYFEAIGVLARENVLLREGRDKLLPRLLREEA